MVLIIGSLSNLGRLPILFKNLIQAWAVMDVPYPPDDGILYVISRGWA